MAAVGASGGRGPKTPETVRTPPGSRSVDVYEKIEQIGEGTYGQVYTARERETNEIVALKKVRMDNEKEGFPITAIREIKILKSLSHKNVVRLKECVTSKAHESNQNKGSIYMVFEYMDHDLTGLQDRPGIKFSVPQIKCYMKQLLTGLHYCHKNNVLHRDIKGSNLLIDNKGILKLADFGLARPWTSENANALTNRVITLWYRPPELLLGAQKYGPEIDMWSVGCIFAELLLGKAILAGKNEMEQVQCIFKLCGSPTEENWPGAEKLRFYHMFKPEKPLRRRLNEQFKNLPGDALELIDKLLTLDPKNRLTAEQALLHDYFVNEPRPCEPGVLPQYEASHEFPMKKKRHAQRAADEANKRVNVGQQNPPHHRDSRNGPPGAGAGAQGAQATGPPTGGSYARSGPSMGAAPAGGAQARKEGGAKEVGITARAVAEAMRVVRLTAAGTLSSNVDTRAAATGEAAETAAASEEAAETVAATEEAAETAAATEEAAETAAATEVAATDPVTGMALITGGDLTSKVRRTHQAQVVTEEVEKAAEGTPEPLIAYFGEREPGLDDSWQHIIVHPSGALRRWERSRGGGWFLEDATRAKEPVAPFSLPLSNAFWKQVSVTDEYEYRGIPYTGRGKAATPTNSDDSGAGAVTWSKEKLPDSDDDDDAGATNSKHDDDAAGATDSKHDMDTASPKWEYDTPGEYDTDTEDDVSEFDDLVADDAEEHAEARRLKRLGLQLIMDDKGELIWVPKGTSPTSPVQPEDQPIPEPKSDAISDDAPAPVVKTESKPKKPPIIIECRKTVPTCYLVDSDDESELPPRRKRARGN
ncbi:hypothetical protein CYMTET_40962 [Cymbomonas tetramitiformis]|uniref:Protein kinase domain-containing protein n=1 Tax=Cymbomonas tetramitiformis TaxID=36881 RepID=A0AAE0C8D4_9CHLO|nr:hypothetical protein CYMTET_40962 [Cymbomonas tetramitiformis]